jgi:colicin import membrane protein
VGQEVISAYESIDMSDVVSSRQPFAAKSRVKLETAAQSFGDRLYEQRFDPRSGQASTSP